MTVLAAVAFYVVGWASMDGFEPGAAASGLLSYLPRVLLLPVAVPGLGDVRLDGHRQREPGADRVAGRERWGWPSCTASAAEPPGGRRRTRRRPRCGSSSAYLTPFGHNDGLSYPPGGELLGDVAVCLALAVVYFALGFMVLRRRDV